MKVTLLSHTFNPVGVCKEATSICVGRKGFSTKALLSAVRSGHESVLEHASFTFLVEGISRVTLAQLTRHRLASYSVLSQRYVDMADRETVMPHSVYQDPDLVEEWREMVEEIHSFYERLVDLDIPSEDARYILPEGTTADLIMTMDARELRHFFELRCCNRAQWEIRELADHIFLICKHAAPELFVGAGPACVRGACREDRPCGHGRAEDSLFYIEEGRMKP